MVLTIAGLVVSGAGALLIALLDPDPTDIVQQIGPDHPDYALLDASSPGGRKWNEFVARPPTMEGDVSRFHLTAGRERWIRLRLGWGGFVLGVALQIVGEVV